MTVYHTGLTVDDSVSYWSDWMTVYHTGLTVDDSVSYWSDCG